MKKEELANKKYTNNRGNCKSRKKYTEEMEKWKRQEENKDECYNKTSSKL